MFEIHTEVVYSVYSAYSVVYSTNNVVHCVYSALETVYSVYSEHSAYCIKYIHTCRQWDRDTAHDRDTANSRLLCCNHCIIASKLSGGYSVCTVLNIYMVCSVYNSFSEYPVHCTV